ncbi:helix-turn-helix transcriptional regulator [Novipirellula aureliae]|nr:WYL domain-containing transcriptional regulator [Novipirellula aureliae]
MKNQRPDSERRLRQAARLADHLRLLQLLLGRGRWDYDSLAVQLECSTRTIRRRLDALELAGVPWFYDSDARCIRVLPGVKFPVLQLTRDELLDEATAATVGRAKGLDVGAGAVATEKLAAASKDEVAEMLADAQRIMEALDLKLADHSKHHEVLRTIQWALIEGRQITGQYKSPYQEKTIELRLHPLRICLTGQAWYLIARKTASERPKTYRVTRFQTVRSLDAKADVPEEFDLDEYFGKAWSVFRGGETYDIELLFKADAAELVTETMWHKTQQVARHPNGTATLRFTVDGLDEIVWWVLGWSGRVTVVEPAELRDLVLQKLNEAIDLHIRR